MLIGSDSHSVFSIGRSASAGVSGPLHNSTKNAPCNKPRTRIPPLRATETARFAVIDREVSCTLVAR
jgi:hypothetical protein